MKFNLDDHVWFVYFNRVHDGYIVGIKEETYLERYWYENKRIYVVEFKVKKYCLYRSIWEEFKEDELFSSEKEFLRSL